MISSNKLRSEQYAIGKLVLKIVLEINIVTKQRGPLRNVVCINNGRKCVDQDNHVKSYFICCVVKSQVALTHYATFPRYLMKSFSFNFPPCNYLHGADLEEIAESTTQGRDISLHNTTIDLILSNPANCNTVDSQ